MNRDTRDAYIKGIKDEYEKAREAHANKKSDKRFVTLEQARADKFKIDVTKVAPAPSFTGTKVFEAYPLDRAGALY